MIPRLARGADPRNGLAEIVVFFEGGPNQLPELIVLEDLEPFEIPN